MKEIKKEFLIKLLKYHKIDFFNKLNLEGADLSGCKGLPI